MAEEPRNLVPLGVGLAVGTLLVAVGLSSLAGAWEAPVVQIGLWLGYLAAFVACVFAIVDAARHDDARWARIGRNKTAWLLFAVSGLVCGFTSVAAPVLYFTEVRPALHRNRYGPAPSNRLPGFPGP